MKLPVESVKPAARTWDPAGVKPKTGLVLVNAVEVGGKTSIWSWLPGVPSGSRSVPKTTEGSGTAGWFAIMGLAKIAFRFVRVFLIAIPESVNFGFKVRFGVDASVDVVLDVFDVSLGADVEGELVDLGLRVRSGLLGDVAVDTGSLYRLVLFDKIIRTLNTLSYPPNIKIAPTRHR